MVGSTLALFESKSKDASTSATVKYSITPCYKH